MSLESKLEKLREGSKERIPAESREIMHKATNDLRASGILDRVLKPGAAAPSFALPNTAGETISSSELLARGPLVATFYRGVW